MILQTIFKQWCRLRGYNHGPTVYLGESTLSLHPGEARLVRMVSRSTRGMHPRDKQRYVVEVRVGDTLRYPFGTQAVAKKQFLAEMAADVMRLERKSQ
jgi:hypothetical protein